MTRWNPILRNEKEQKVHHIHNCFGYYSLAMCGSAFQSRRGHLVHSPTGMKYYLLLIEVSYTNMANGNQGSRVPTNSLVGNSQDASFAVPATPPRQVKPTRPL